MTNGTKDDKRVTLLREAAAALDNAAVSVAVSRRAPASGSATTWPAELHHRGGWRHSALLHPVLGAIGYAALERITSNCSSSELPVIVVAPAIGPELRDALIARGLGYLDLAGNCHLELDGGKVTIHIEGRRRAERVLQGGTLRAAGY